MGEGTLKARIAALEQELAEAKKAHTSALEEGKSAKAELSLLRDETDRATAMAARYKKEADELRAEMSKAKRDGDASMDLKIQKLQEQLKLSMDQLDELNDKHTKLEKDYASLKDLYDKECKKRKSFEDEAQMFMKRERQAQNELEKERKEREKVVREIETRVKEVTSATKRARDAEKHSEERGVKIKVLEKSTKDLDAENKRLLKEMDDLAKSKDAMLEKANNALQRLKGQVLQMTCQGLLRLCVVAPRVTIAFEMKNINVAAVLPSGEIRAMLERELLPKYTKVFLQKEENRGPENEEMEKWLQELLRDMETKIEQKLVSVLNDSMPQGSVVSSSKD